MSLFRKKKQEPKEPEEPEYTCGICFHWFPEHALILDEVGNIRICFSCHWAVCGINRCFICHKENRVEKMMDIANHSYALKDRPATWICSTCRQRIVEARDAMLDKEA